MYMYINAYVRVWITRFKIPETRPQRFLRLTIKRAVT